MIAGRAGLYPRCRRQVSSMLQRARPPNPPAGAKPVRLNNRVRRAVEAALGSMTLLSSDAGTPPRCRPRRVPLPRCRRVADPRAGHREGERRPCEGSARDGARRDRSQQGGRFRSREACRHRNLEGPRQSGRPGSSHDPAGRRAGRCRRGRCKGRRRASARRLALWNAVQNVWYGVSLGSVLLLAAIGLAITFGTMGVINMAHGEMVMIGAYTTFVVQELIRTHAPDLFGASLFIALPLAFLVAGPIGILIERTRHPLPLWPAARDAARHLGHLAHPAAGRAHDLRPHQPRGRHAGLDERRFGDRRPEPHLQPHRHRGLRLRGLRDPAARAALHVARPATCAP